MDTKTNEEIKASTPTRRRRTRMSFMKRPRTVDAPLERCQPQFAAVEIRLCPADATRVRKLLEAPR